METFTEVQNPNDITYRMNRANLVRELCKMSVNQLDMQIQYLSRQAPPRDESGEVTKSVINELKNAPYIPNAIKAGGILDSGGAYVSGATTSGNTSGGVLIRQDLEAPMYAYVKLSR